VGAALTHTKGRTDMNLIGTSHDYAKAPKKNIWYTVTVMPDLKKGWESHSIILVVASCVRDFIQETFTCHYVVLKNLVWSHFSPKNNKMCQMF
jgi:hypothetical protein